MVSAVRKLGLIVLVCGGLLVVKMGMDFSTAMDDTQQHRFSVRGGTKSDPHIHIPTGDKTFSDQETKTPYDPNDITVVTFYVSIGSFQKGYGNLVYTPDRYKEWMRTYGWLTNKVVAYFADDETLQYFKKLRSGLPAHRTVVKKLDMSMLEAYKNYDKVKQIFAKPNYPKHPPNTVNVDYSILMNAKYDVLQMAIDGGHVSTDFMAWLDIGTFRNLVQPELAPKDGRFSLEVPSDMDRNKIAFTEVGSRNDMINFTAWEYIQSNHVWVSGSMMVGAVEKIRKFIPSYKKTVDVLLGEGMASTDQQVIGAMYSPKYLGDQEVDIQPYRCRDGDYGLYSSDIAYFCLGYVCKAAAESRRNETRIKT
ncbi:unnamed protein product [Lymnaea stagnalis]|uniref:Uncharacterized protein n=1 Tax=Lymnaea stagnalis TaxID=6523 RepID=A0AAV2HN40_LYMST